MIKITKATKKDSLEKDWQDLIDQNYGKNKKWKERYFSFKAVDNGKIVGTIEYKYEPGVVYISALMITKEYRGQGIGTMLLNRAEEYSKKLGAHKLWLLTGKIWPSNNFYKKLGFKFVTDLPDFYFHKDFVLYTREIK